MMKSFHKCPEGKLESSELSMEFQQIGVSKDFTKKAFRNKNKKREDQERSQTSRKPTETIEIVEVDDIDDFDGFFCTPFSKKGNNNTAPISVEHYNEEKNLNVAIMASLKSSTAAKSTNNVTDHVNFVDLPQWNYQNICHIDGTYTYGDNDDLRVLNFRPLSTASTIKKEKKRKLFGNSVTQKGQSSKPNNVPDFVCEICVETKKQNQSFPIQGCSHVYCTECTAKYIVSKLQENIINIQCPVSRCSGLFELEHCSSILPKETFDRWGSALCEALILESQKFYCPFKDCSAMLINDGGEVIKESECPNCRRLFCARCKVPWHSGISCEKFQTLHKDEREKEDIMLMNLADDKKWKRCPRCRIYVERTEGCRYMKCRCGTSFCYGCGSTKISALHHNCSKCKG